MAAKVVSADDHKMFRRTLGRLLISEDDSVYSVLTRKEREVLQLVSEGKSSKVIAEKLKRSAKTVEWHRGQPMKKLAVQSVAGLVTYAISEGLTCSYT